MGESRLFKQLGIDSKRLPKPIYPGRTNGRIRYFHSKMPVAVEGDRAIFAYMDPGMSTGSPLPCWGQAHRQLWDNLRQASRAVEVFAVAWEQHFLDRAARVLQSWIAGDMTEADRELLALRQAVSSADWDALERYGGLNAALKKINQLKQETPALNDQGMIDDVHLWGSRRFRRIGETATT